MKTRYVCEGCGNEYSSPNKALKCEDSTETKKVVNVGDIVLAKGGYGWFDGNIRWVLNPDVKKLLHKHNPSINCFSDCCLFNFYYVVTFIDSEKHRVRYHLVTNAMTGKRGYHSGYTYNEHHYIPQKVNNPPEFVLKDSKNLVGEKAPYLL